MQLFVLFHKHECDFCGSCHSLNKKKKHSLLFFCESFNLKYSGIFIINFFNHHFCNYCDMQF